MRVLASYFAFSRAAYVLNCAGDFGGLLPLFKSTIASLLKTGS
jgi:hypothetical protein